MNGNSHNLSRVPGLLLVRIEGLFHVPAGKMSNIPTFEQFPTKDQRTNLEVYFKSH